MSDMIRGWEQKALFEGGIGFEDAYALLALDGPDVYELLGAANRVARKFRSWNAELCGIVNAKAGRCAEDCAFCAQSAHHAAGAGIHELLGEEQLLRAAARAEAARAQRFGIVTAGTGLSDNGELDRLQASIERICRETGVKPCASLGIMEEKALLRLKNAGLVRYHHNLETARSFFPSVCSTHNYDEDVETVKAAKRAGLEVCTGGIFGLGESIEHRAEFALDLKSLDVDCIPVNFLVSVTGTPLQSRLPLAPLECLKIIAMLRFVMPDKSIRVCAGREQNLQDLQPLIFFAGADGLMIGNYLTTAGRNTAADMDMIRNLGFTPALM